MAQLIVIQDIQNQCHLFQIISIIRNNKIKRRKIAKLSISLRNLLLKLNIHLITTSIAQNHQEKKDFKEKQEDILTQ